MSFHRSLLWSPVSCIVGGLLASLAEGAFARSQDEEPPEFDREAWEEAYEEFVKSGEDDGRAIECLTQVLAAYPDLEPRDQKAVVKTVEKGLNRRREEDDNLLFSEIVKTLGRMPGAGEKASLKALRHDNVDERFDVLVFALPALARHGNARHVPTLTDYLVHREARVIAAAVEALGEFDEHRELDRKKIVAELVKAYSAIYANSLQVGNRDREAGQPVKRPDKKTLEMTQKAFESSLSRLTGAEVQGSSNWHRWYGDHRKKRWPARKGDEEEDGGKGG